MQKPLWTPNAERIERARMSAFLRATGKSGYDELYRWSIDRPEAFWRAVWDFTEVIGDPGETVLAGGERMPGACWFPDARLNYAENLLRRRDSAPAIVLRREDGFRREISFAELYEEVARLQTAFRAAGLEPGDRVAAFIPNIPEAISGLLAVASLGGVWSSASQDFGAQGVIDRFGQIEPKFLLVADGYRYKDKLYSSEEKLRAVLAGLPSVEKTLVIPYTGEGTDPATIPGAVSYRDFVDSAPTATWTSPASPSSTLSTSSSPRARPGSPSASPTARAGSCCSTSRSSSSTRTSAPTTASSTSQPRAG